MNVKYSPSLLNRLKECDVRIRKSFTVAYFVSLGTHEELYGKLN